MLITFEIYNNGAFWCSRGIGVNIFTQARTLDELMENIREAVGLHYEESIDAGEQITIITQTEF